MHKYKLMEVNEDINELLGTKYDRLFKANIRPRGISYSRLNKVNNIVIKDNIVNAQVTGTNNYDVAVELEEENLKKVSCTCLYHNRDIYCKHIYALLYELSKKEKEEARKRYKKYVLYNANQVNNFFIEVNDLIKYNKEKLSDDFFLIYEDIFYHLDGRYEELKLDNKSLSQLNDYLKIIKKDYKKVEDVYNKVIKIKNINLDIDTLKKETKEKQLNKSKIEKEMYKDNISIERLLELRKQMLDLSFYDEDIKYVEERVNCLIEELEDIDKIEKLIPKLKENNLSTVACVRTIRRLKGIKVEDVEKLDKQDLEYFIHNSDDIFVLINIKKNMSKYKFDEETYNDIEEYIKSAIDSIYEIDKLKEVKKLMKEYKFNLSYINEAIYNLKNGIYKENKEPLLRKLDAYIESTPLEVLEKVSIDNQVNKRDNRIIEKAIKNKKKKIKEIERKKRKEAMNDLLHSFAKLGAIFSVFSSNSKSSKHSTFNDHNYSSIEQEEILKGNYEPYQFEEEDLEEDDYYFEDDLD